MHLASMTAERRHRLRLGPFIVAALAGHSRLPSWRPGSSSARRTGGIGAGGLGKHSRHAQGTVRLLSPMPRQRPQHALLLQRPMRPCAPGRKETPGRTPGTSKGSALSVALAFVSLSHPPSLSSLRHPPAHSMFRPLLLLSVLGLVACAPAPQVTAAPQPAITGYPALLAVAQRGSLSSIDGQAQASAVGAFLDDLRSHASDSAYLSSAVNEMEQNQFGFVTAVIATAEGDPALKSQFVSNFDERVQSVGEQYRSAATIK